MVAPKRSARAQVPLRVLAVVTLGMSALAGCGASRPLVQVTDAASADADPAERPASWSRGHGIGPRCLDLSHADELLCRADKRLMEARAWGDEKALACYVRKGRELRTAYRLGEDTRNRLRSGDSAIDRERLAYADRLLERSFVELEACNGPLDGEGDSVKVEAPKDLPLADGALTGG